MTDSTSNETLRRVVLRLLQGIGLTAILCIFAYSTGAVFPFVTPKFWFFCSCVALMLPLMVLVWGWYPERRLNPHPFFFLGLFFVCLTLSAVLAADPLRAWFSTAERMMGVVSWCAAVIWVAGMVQAFRTIREQQLLCGWVVGTATLLSLLGAWEWQYGGFLSGELHRQVWATTGNSTLLAAYLSCALFFALPLVPAARRRLAWAVPLGLCVGIILIGLALTDGRSSLLGVCLAAGVVGSGALWRFRKTVWGRHAFFLSGCVASGACVAAWVMRARLQETFSHFWESGLYDRSLLIHAALAGMRNHLLLGVGTDQFSYLFNSVYRSVDYIFFQDVRWADQSHNLTADILLSSGVLGAAAATLFFITVVWRLGQRLLKEDFWQAAGWAGGVVAYLVTHQFTPQSFGPHLLFLLCLAYAVQRERKSVSLGRQASARLLQAVTICAAFLSVTFFFFIVLVPARANRDVIRATRLLYAGNVQSALALYDSAFLKTALFRVELRGYAAREVAEVVQVIHPLETAMAQRWSLQQWTANAADRPLEVIDRLTFAQLALVVGRDNPAILENGWNMLFPTLLHSPGRPQIRYTLSRIALAQRKPEAAADVMRAPIFALEREPEWFWLQARIAHMRGDLQEARYFFSKVKNDYRYLGAEELAEALILNGETDPIFAEKIKRAQPDGE